VARSTVAKGRFFSNIFWSSVQNGALADAKSVCAGRNQRKSRASFAVQNDLAPFRLAGVMRIELNGVRVTAFSST